MKEQPQEHRVEITVPPDHEVGVHASFASVWRTQDSFVIDFSTEVRPPEVAEDPESGDTGTSTCPPAWSPGYGSRPARSGS